MSLIDLRIEERIFESKLATFAVRSDDLKALDLIEDAPLTIEGDDYFITKVEDVMDDKGVKLKYIEAEIDWMRLTDVRKPVSFEIDDTTAETGLESILSGTQWTTGNSDVTGTYSYEGTDMSVLALIWEWCRVVGGEPIFDSQSKTVTILQVAGAYRGLSFRYARNVQEIRRTSIPPKATRIFPYGRNDLDVSAIEGTTFIEDYSWYTNQGISEDEAKTLYRKDEIYKDDAIIEDTVLHSVASARLALVSQAQVSYKAKVLDLSTLSHLDEGLFRVGDFATIFDEIVGNTLDSRVVRHVEFPASPEKNEVELSFNAVPLPETNTSNARSNTTKSWELFVSRNRSTNAHSVRIGSTIINRMSLKTISNAEWVMGYTLRATAVGASTVTFEFTDDETGLPVWSDMVRTLTDGEVVDFAWTFGEKELPAGTTTVVVRAYSDSGSAGVDVETTHSSLWVLARGTTRKSVILENSIVYEFNGDTNGLNGSVREFVVPDDVYELLVESIGGGGGYSGTTFRGGGVKASVRMAVTPGETLSVYVGGKGNASGNQQFGAWPNGGDSPETAAGGIAGGGGGGSTHLLRNDTFDATNVLICAPGGGAVNLPGLSRNTVAEGITAGDAGFFQGLSGNGQNGANYDTGATVDVGGGGASQSAGGLAGTTGGGGVAGSFNQGGASGGSSNSFHFCGGGGGGGYYGGGGAGTPVLKGGGSYAGDGGGGSGWMGPGSYDLEFTDGTNYGDGKMTISWETPVDVG